MRGFGISITAGAAGFALATGALAHTPYIAPTTFAPDREYVSATAAMTEGNFFVPDFPLRGGTFEVVGPDGAVTKLGEGTTLKEFTVVEAPLPQEGTWRITTGQRAGRAGKWAKVDGQWRPVRPAGRAGQPQRPEPPRAPPGEAPGRAGPIEESAIPAGAETMTSQSYLCSETYVTRGAPSPGALKASGVGFELTPETHPNELYAGEAFKFGLTDDGKPAAAHYVVARAGEAYAEKKFSLNGQAGADGKAAVVLTEPGVYVMEIHYPERAVGDTAPLAKSTTYTLTFEVTR